MWDKSIIYEQIEKEEFYILFKILLILQSMHFMKYKKVIFSLSASFQNYRSDNVVERHFLSRSPSPFFCYLLA